MFYFKVLSTYSALNKHICNRFVLLFKNQENIRLRDAPYFHTKYLMYVQRIVRNNKWYDFERNVGNTYKNNGKKTS